MNDRIFGVARGKQHLQSGPAFRQFVGELAAVHRARHDHVGKQQIERVAGCDDRLRFRRGRRIQRGVAQRVQLRQHIVSDQLVVFNDENGFVAALNGRCTEVLGRRLIAGARR